MNDALAPHADEGVPTITTELSLVRMPVRTIAAEVLSGPDTGRMVVADDDTLAIGTAEGNQLVLTDPTVSRFHAVLTRQARAPGGIAVVDRQSTNGTVCGDVRMRAGIVPPGSVLVLGNSHLRVLDGAEVQIDIHATDSFGGLRGRSPLMRHVFALSTRAADNDLPVLIVGESGTGKEMIARAIHDRSARARGPFVTVDCASLSPTLVASELFGHEKGAFTGADRRHEGAFERARGGTIFLDEIGELPEALQPLLLGALERRRFRRLGGREEVIVDARVLSATNRDLQAEVNSGKFRLDLYYRMAVLQISAPALRDRPEDIEILIEHFLREAGHDGRVDRHFTRTMIDQLRRYHWPGNARELRNLVETTIAMGEPPPMTPIPATPASGFSRTPSAMLQLPYKDARAALLRDFEESYLGALIERSDGNLSQAARSAGIDRTHLFTLLKRRGLR